MFTQRHGFDFTSNLYNCIARIQEKFTFVNGDFRMTELMKNAFSKIQVSYSNIPSIAVWDKTYHIIAALAIGTLAIGCYQLLQKRKIQLKKIEEKRELAVTNLQRLFRGFTARQKFKEVKAAELIQRLFRGYVARQEFTKVKTELRDLAAHQELKKVKAADSIQRLFRGFTARQKLKEVKAAESIQRLFRGYTARQEFKKVKATESIQRLFRGFAARQEFKKVKTELRVKEIKVVLLGELLRNHALRTAATRIQACFRGHSTRNRIENVRFNQPMILKNIREFAKAYEEIGKLKRGNQLSIENEKFKVTRRRLGYDIYIYPEAEEKIKSLVSQTETLIADLRLTRHLDPHRKKMTALKICMEQARISLPFEFSPLKNQIHKQIHEIDRIVEGATPAVIDTTASVFYHQFDIQDAAIIAIHNISKALDTEAYVSDITFNKWLEKLEDLRKKCSLASQGSDESEVRAEYQRLIPKLNSTINLIKTTKTGRKEIKVRAQINVISDAMLLENHKLTLAKLTQWNSDLSTINLSELSDSTQERVRETQQRISDELETQRSGLRKFVEDLQKETPISETLSMIGGTPLRILNEERAQTALKDFSSTEKIQATLELRKSVGLHPQLIIGASILIAQTLKSHLKLFIGHSENLNTIKKKQIESIRSLVDFLLEADRFLQKDDPGEDEISRNLDTQATLLNACRYLASYFQKKDITSAFDYLREASNIKLMQGHALGNLNELQRKCQTQDVVWIQAGDTAIRHRQIRATQKRIVIGEETQSFFELTFTLTRGVREELEAFFIAGKDTLENNRVIIEETEARYHGYNFKDRHFKGDQYSEVGKERTFSNRHRTISVSIGADVEKWNQYHTVKVKVQPGVSSQEVHSFLSLLGLPTVMMESRNDDHHNEKIARATAYLYPKMAVRLNSPEQWIAFAENKTKAERDIIQKYILEMKLEDVGAGRKTYVSPTALEEFEKAGGCAFGATLGHDGVKFDLNIFSEGIYRTRPIDTSARNLAMILQKGGGFLSTMERMDRGIISTGADKVGCCPDENIKTGSANQVFLRPHTRKQFRFGHDWKRYAIEGNIFVLVKKKAAKLMPNTYTTDHSGVRNPNFVGTKLVRVAQKEWISRDIRGSDIENRVTLPEFAEVQERTHWPLPTAETVAEHMLSNELVYGAIVKSEQDKHIVVETLKEQNIYLINGFPVENAIFVSDQFDGIMLEERMPETLTLITE